MVYSAYLPPCYDENAAVYPVIYLMHGSNEDDGQWLRLGLEDVLDEGILAGDLPLMIVVLPFGDVIANRNRFDSLSWGSIFLQELLPAVEGRYRIDARRETRAIGGISRGGFWAFHIALRRPDLFSAVGGHSAFFDPYHAPPEDNPLDLAASAEGVDGLRIWLDRGKDDFAAPGIDWMHERLAERGLPHEYVVYPEGQHNNAYWSQHVLDYLRFYAAAWGKPSPLFAAAAPAPTSLPASEGIALFLPAVSFPSLQTDIRREQLQAVFDGQVDGKLALDADTAAALSGYGVKLARDTRIVEPGALLNVLWRDRTLYTLLPFDRLTPLYRVLRVDEVHPLDGDLAAYPFAFAGDAPNFDPGRLTRIVLSGVTALARGTREALDQHGVEWAGEALLPYVTKADFFHTSSEVSIYPTCPETEGERLGGVWSMCARPEHFGLFKYLDVDIVELSGNHNNDYSFEAYRDTLRFYRDSGILTVGGGKTLGEARAPLLIAHNGNRIAMVACNWIGPVYALADDAKSQPGAAYCDWNWLSGELPALAAHNDVVIVTVQYQEFEEYTPPQKQRYDFRALADLGADVVIGTSAHKPQTFEFYTRADGGQAFIHYGLGNLFFDQQFWGNMRFFMDQVYIYEGRLLTVDLFTGIIEDRARPRPMTPDERANFLHFMFVQQNGF